MALINCPKCGKDYSEHANNCPSCGFITAEALTIIEKKNFSINCPDCGNLIVGEEEYCSKCGCPTNVAITIQKKREIELICPDCGNVFTSEYEFCPICGCEVKLFKKVIAEKEEFKRLEKERLEREAKEKAERLEKERIEREAKEEAERLEKERLEREAKEEAERLEKERLEREAKEEAERLEKERLEREAKEEEQRKNKSYDFAQSLMAEDKVSSYKKAIEIFNSILEWKDSSEQVKLCEKQMAERQIEEDKRAKKTKKTIAIVLLISCIIALVFIGVILPSLQYNEAMELCNAGKYSEAAEIFSSLNYKDSGDKAKECLTMLQIKSLSDVKIGKTIKFGYYEQDNNEANGEEEIEWIVKAIEGNKVLLISKYALDCKQYNTSCTNVTWETCSLRKWLNNEFLNEAFDSTLQKCIASSKVTADENPEYDTNPGHDTIDKVFLLSITEVEKYLASGRCEPTAYTVAKGAYKDDNGYCNWWLRSPGLYQNYAAYVYYVGSVHCVGGNVGYGSLGVRPALWITLES